VSDEREYEQEYDAVVCRQEPLQGYGAEYLRLEGEGSQVFEAPVPGQIRSKSHLLHHEQGAGVVDLLLQVCI